jgi:hypothetical protein
MACQLWMVEGTAGVDPDECDHDDAWTWGRVITRCRMEAGMGERKRRRAALQQQSESEAAPGPGRRRYHWDPKIRWYRLAEIDGEPIKNGPLLDIDLGELDRHSQTEFESQENSRRGIRQR